MSREPCDMLFKPCEPGMQDCVGFGHCRCQKELDRQANLRQQLATLTQERDALKRIIDDTLREVPVGNVNAHIPENLPRDMEYYVQETVKQDFEIERLEKERDALREENTRLRKYIGVMDAALKIPDGASTTAERCKRTNSLIGSDDWMEEPACLCVVCRPPAAKRAREVGCEKYQQTKNR